MFHKLRFIFVIFSSIIFTGWASVQAAEGSLQSVISACKNITPQQRQMAKAAGYDVDSLCSSAKSSGGKVDTSKPAVVKARANATQETDKLLETTFVEANGATSLKEDRETRMVNQRLKQFGYDLFSGAPTTFAPVSEIPVMSDYLIGPGDNIKIQFFGKLSASHTLTVSRDGTVQFPDLGPITLAGLTFEEMKALLTERVEKQMIGVQASITLGDLRSIRIFVLGDATRPGSYTVSALSSMTNALFVSGGVRKIGSLRNIQLKRQGKVVTSLDLYDLLLKGDTSNDVRLQPGDVIFIPPVGKTAGIAGEVKRPAIYELKSEKDAKDLVALAGGYLPSAYPKASRIERINKEGERTLIDIDLKTTSGETTQLANGDVLQVYSVLEKMENVVLLDGHVYRPGGFSFKAGMRVTDLIGGVDQMLPAPDLDYGLLVREKQPTREIEVHHINLRGALENPDSKANRELAPRDRLIVFAATESRAGKLNPIIAKLVAQQKNAEPSRVVSAKGVINFPGLYPMTENMSVRDLVYAAGGLRDATYQSDAEITRKDYSNPEAASIKHFLIPLDKALENESKHEYLLEAGDSLSLKMIPKYQERLMVTLGGEVKFPGSYEFVLGETLSDVVKRAGGLTELAHMSAAVFTRADLRAREAKQLADFRERLKSDLAAAELEDTRSGKSRDFSTLSALLNMIDDSEAVGRLVINLSGILSGTVEDIQLRDGDALLIPTHRQEITIIGEVQNPTAHLFDPAYDHLDYIEKSGSTTSKADEDRIYVVKADGSVFLPEKSGWFHDEVNMSPGDTIVVPLEVDKLDKLTLWTSVSQIIYQVALGAAAIKSF